MAMITESSWSCHVCASTSRRVLAPLVGKDGRSYHAVRCKDCGLLAAAPILPLSIQEYQEVYSQAYYRSGWCDGGQGYLDEAKVASMEKEAHDQRREIERITGLRGGAILDVGCGDGRYLNEFRQAGWRAVGVEVSRYAAQLARERFHLEVFDRPVESLQLEAEQFDLVRLKHCIEHLQEPRRTLQEVFRLLKPGGYAVIDTDNARGLRSRCENAIRRAFGRTLTRAVVRALTGKDLDTKYGRLSPPIHWYTFDRFNLGVLLQQVGLEVIHSLQPAQGHPIWFPQLHRYGCHPLEAMFRLLDDLGGRIGQGEVLVVFARKPAGAGSNRES